MDFSEHLIISAAGSAAILGGGGDWASAGAFCATGVFIDLDHLADYWRETGLNADVPRFLAYFSLRQPTHLLLFLHGWEWCLLSFALLAALNFAAAWPWWAAAGWLLHLALDHRFNRLHPFAYFLSYRARHGFKARRFYKD